MIVIDDGPGRMSARPLPQPDHVTHEFWAAAARGVLLVQKCRQCGRLQFYPRAMCTTCAGDVDWFEVSGRGSVFTFTIIRQNSAPPFDAFGAYVVAMIELHEGPMMMANVTDIGPDDVAIGLPVEAYAVKVDNDLAIPLWRPALSSPTTD